MCQILDIDSKYTVAEEDITFYKVLQVLEVHGETKFVLPFMGSYVEVGHTYEEPDQKEFTIGHVRSPYNLPSGYTTTGHWIYLGTTTDTYSAGFYYRCIAEGGFHLFQTEGDAKSFMLDASGGNSVFKLFRAIVPKGTAYIDGYYDASGLKLRTVCAKKVRYEFMEARRHRK